MIRRIEKTHLLLAIWSLGLLTLTGLVLGFCAITASSLEREAIVRQQIRTDQIALRLEEKFLVNEQLARTLAALAAPMRSRQEVEQLLRSVLESTSERYVYGVGVWFEPYAFSPRERDFGPYVHRSIAGHAGSVLTYEWATPAYDFHHQPWYRQGIVARNDVAFIEPYFDTDYVYMSTIEPMLNDRGEPSGVVSVDVVLPQIQRMIEASSSVGDTVFVVTRKGALLAHPAAAEILDWARARGPARESLLEIDADDLSAFEAERGPARDAVRTTATVPRLGWTAVVTSDRQTTFASARHLRWAAAPVIAALWSGALSLLLSSRRARRTKELAQELERRELVQAIVRESERRLRAVLEAALHAVVGMDGRGLIMDWNPQAEAMFGWSLAEVLGRRLSEVLLAERFRGPHTRGIAELFRSGVAPILNQRSETSALRRDGSELPVELIVTQIEGSEGPLFYAFIADISERKRVDDERRQLLERIRRRSAELQAILDNMVDGVIACDASRRLTMVNNAARRLLGLDPGTEWQLDAMVERNHLRHPDGQPTTLEDLPLMRALTGGSFTQGNVVFQVPGAPRETHMHGSAAPIRDDQGRIVAAVAVLRDVTGALELDHLKDQFLKVTAHELKTPITIMKSYAQLALRQSEGLSPSLRKKLEGINRGADGIDRILRDVLEVSQVYLGRLQVEMTVVDLRELVEQAVARFGVDTSRHRVRAHAEVAAKVQGDRQRLESVLSTLLDNAIRYSPGGGDVEVRLTVERGAAVVAVADQGIGIPAAGQDRIFERFYRAHSGTPQDYGGLGVGLYISKQLVQRLGGRMWFLSQPSGSCFMFALPLAPSEGRES